MEGPDNPSRFIQFRYSWIIKEKTMTPESVMTLGQKAMEVTLMVSAPMLLVALATGLVVSIFQAATQINEMTLSFIPKLVALFATMVLAGPWMLSIMVDYMRQVLEGIPAMVG
jgi:flagellar biosynthetic protein FliQ